MILDTRILEEMKANYAAQIVEEFCYLHDQDLLGAKFKIGELVSVLKEKVGGQECVWYDVVVAVNETDEGVFEYAVKGYPWLVWESELTLGQEG